MVSSGNDGRENTADGINVLAANDDVIAVGALDRAETARAAWSQQGDLLDVYAPGEDVMVDMPWFYSGERAVNGTSFGRSQGRRRGRHCARGGDFGVRPSPVAEPIRISALGQRA